MSSREEPFELVTRCDSRVFDPRVLNADLTRLPREAVNLAHGSLFVDSGSRT